MNSHRPVHDGKDCKRSLKVQKGVLCVLSLSGSTQFESESVINNRWCTPKKGPFLCRFTCTRGIPKQYMMIYFGLRKSYKTEREAQHIPSRLVMGNACIQTVMVSPMQFSNDPFLLFRKGDNENVIPFPFLALVKGRKITNLRRKLTSKG